MVWSTPVQLASPTAGRGRCRPQPGPAPRRPGLPRGRTPPPRGSGGGRAAAGRLGPRKSSTNMGGGVGMAVGPRRAKRAFARLHIRQQNSCDIVQNAPFQNDEVPPTPACLELENNRSETVAFPVFILLHSKWCCPPRSPESGKDAWANAEAWVWTGGGYADVGGQVGWAK